VTEAPPKTHTIWKYPLELVDVQTISLPKGAEFRLLADQGGTLTLWYEVDPGAEKADIQIIIAGTGHEIPVGLMHLGSIMQGAFVWHVYRVPTLTDVFMALGGIRYSMKSFRHSFSSSDLS